MTFMHYASCLKFNKDEAVKGSSAVGSGGVLRDDHGDWVMGFCNNMGTSNSLLAELTGIRTAVEFILDDNYPHVVIESDCLEAVNMISGSSPVAGAYGEIVDAIRRGISFHGNISCCFTPREANLVADWLAIAALMFPFGTHRLTSPLRDCHRLILLDKGEGLSSLSVEPSA
ncbi:uncharacterized protein LOC130720035 [Lotus japonicus]|uniref:uncharacterized protein LOC130720035 n=1 Tax=Lotus japonicus TaxID=34305 RepID=UPI002585CB91|nr:uncharacterized protein LOC130720035 [Lotus japonicus]